MKSSQIASSWDRAYAQGKYEGEEPIPFVKDIVKAVKAEGLASKTGFYPGCGNGRNLAPLLEAGLNVEASDISPIAIRQLRKRLPNVKAKVADFLEPIERKYAYLLSLQLFQHTDEKGIEKLFNQANMLLEKSGLLALRVNSIHTQIVQKHESVGVSKLGGLTIRYESGPKKGQHIHFYSAEEIHGVTQKDFTVVMPLREEFIARGDGTYWTQWETILRKRG